MGYLGEVHPEVLDNYDIGDKVSFSSIKGNKQNVNSNRQKVIE